MLDDVDLLRAHQPEELMYKRWKTDQLAENTRVIFVDKNNKLKTDLDDSCKSSIRIDKFVSE